MLAPKKTKYNKYQKKFLKNSKISTNNNTLKFGKYGLKALQSGTITAKNIEAIRTTITRKFKRNGKVWITIFPHLNVTEKPLEVRMGKGKGNVSFWLCKVKVGQILFEMDGINLQLATKACLIVNKKLFIKTTLVID